MITLIIVIIVQTLIIAVSIKKGIKQLNRANYWKGQYIDASYRYKLQHEPITGDAEIDNRIRRTQEHNNNKSKLEDELDELKRKALACICDNKYCHCLECQEKYNNK